MELSLIEKRLSEKERFGFEFGKMLISLSTCWLQCDSAESTFNIVCSR